MPFKYDIDSLPVSGEKELKRRLAERVSLYASRIKEFKNPLYNETEVRID